jgi:sugar lactone lactonase YvrE
MHGRSLVIPAGLIVAISAIAPLAAQTGPSRIISTVAGTGIYGRGVNGVLATKSELTPPASVAVDAAGNIYIADSVFSVIRKVTVSTGIISIYAGTEEAGYLGDGALATAARLNNPSGLALDASGNLFIADTNNNVIREVNAKTGIITTVAGDGTGAGPGDTVTCTARIDGVLATTTGLCVPSAVALDASGDLFIADSGNDVIRKVTASTGYISTVAGNGTNSYTGNGGLAVNATFRYISGLAVDHTGNLYIADESNCAIRKVAANGVISAFAGAPPNSTTGNASCGLSGDGALASKSLLSYPRGVSVDSSGNVFIADGNNSVVRVVAASNGYIYTVAGSYSSYTSGSVTYSYGNFGYSGNGGPATFATLSQPRAVVADASGNLYIADGTNSVIRKVTAGPIAPTGTPVISPASKTITAPTAVTITSPTAGAAIYYTTNGAIPTISSTKYTAPFTVSTSAVVTAFAVAAGASSDATEAYYLDAPTPVISAPTEVITKSTPITITDANATAKIYYTTDGSDPTISGNAASLLYSGPVTIAASTTLRAAAYTTVTLPGGTTGVYATWSAIASANYTLETTPQTAPNGVITTVAGNGFQGYAGDGGLATKANLAYPPAVAVDAAGNLYIADYTSSVVRKVTASTGVISLYAGTGVAGYLGDKGPATSAQLNFPFGLALDSAGNLYIADSNNSVIREVNAKTGVITTVAGTGVCGPEIDGTTALSAPLCYPEGVAVDNSGNIYIADSSNSAIGKVNAKTVIFTVLVPGDGGGYFGDYNLAIEGQVNYPNGIAVDDAGNVFIADTGNCAIRKIDAANGFIYSLVGQPGEYGFGNCGLSGDGGPAISALIESPTAVQVDRSGNVFLADNANNSVRMISAANGNIYTIAGSYSSYLSNGTTTVYPNFGYTGDGGPATLADLNYPQGAALDSLGNLFIADTYNGVIRKVTNAAVLPTEAPAITPASGAIAAPLYVTIKSPIAGATIYYTTNGTMPTTSSTKYTAPFAVSKSEVVTAFATIPGAYDSPATVADYLYAPTPAIAPGTEVATKAVTVSITDSGVGNTIFYTTDGTSPYLTTAKQYTAALSVTPPATVQAAAYTSVTGPGGAIYSAWSPIASANYGPAAPTPVFSLATGTYSSTQTVSINESAKGYTVYCTTNGLTPTAKSPVCNGPITVSATETIKAIAIAPNYSFSAVATATYTITGTPVIATVSAVSTAETQTITITGSGLGAQSAYSGDSNYIKLTDVTNNGWSAGYAPDGDTVGLGVSSWTASKITLTGFNGNFGAPGNVLNTGDQLTLQIWDATTDAGPAICTLTVGGGATTCSTTTASIKGIPPITITKRSFGSPSDPQ